MNTKVQRKNIYLCDVELEEFSSLLEWGIRNWKKRDWDSWEREDNDSKAGIKIKELELNEHESSEKKYLFVWCRTWRMLFIARMRYKKLKKKMFRASYWTQ